MIDFWELKLRVDCIQYIKRGWNEWMGLGKQKKLINRRRWGMLGIHMGVCLNEGLCDHHMNYVESLEVNYFSIFP